jgi:hypothetical protein
MCAGGDQHLAAHVATLLFRGQLVLEVHAGGAGLDERLHDLEAVEWAAEPGLGVGHDRQEPIARGAAFGVLDLVGPLQRAIDAPAKLGRGVGRIEALIRIHGPGGVVVRRHLPAGKIDRLQAGPGHLHGLIAGHRTQRIDVRLFMERLPQSVGAALGQGVGDLHRTAQLGHIRRRVRPFDPVETPGRGARNQGVETRHVNLSCGAVSLARNQRRAFP